MDESQIEKLVIEIINKTNSSGMKDMGKVMGMASKQLSCKKNITTIRI